MRAEIEKKIVEEPKRFKVDLVGMKIADKEILDIIEKIKAHKPDVQSINLDKNRISDPGAIILGQELANFKDLRELSVQFNKIGKDGAFSLFGLKKVFPRLEILFRDNKITNASVILKIEQQALSHNSGLNLR